MDNEVYVIHHNGNRFEKAGRKIAYLTRGAAKAVVTAEASNMAKDRHEKDWYELPRKERVAEVGEVKKEFEIVTYVPK